MLNICEDLEVEFYIKFNQAKSFPCQFGLDHGRAGSGSLQMTHDPT